MITPGTTPRDLIAKALKQAGDIGLRVDELCTVTQLAHYVVLYTLRNMKAAGRVSIAAGEEYEQDRSWVLVTNPEPRTETAPLDPDANITRFEKANRALLKALTAKHPHGYEDARLMPKAGLVGNRVA